MFPNAGAGVSLNAGAGMSLNVGPGMSLNVGLGMSLNAGAGVFLKAGAGVFSQMDVFPRGEVGPSDVCTTSEDTSLVLRFFEARPRCASFSGGEMVFQTL